MTIRLCSIPASFAHNYCETYSIYKIHSKNKTFNFRLKLSSLSWIIHLIFNRTCQRLSPVYTNEFGLLKTGGITHG